MSTNIRNENRLGYMRNFSTYTIERYIIIDDESMSSNEKDVFVSNINEALWLAIQETNIYASNRILPYVIVRRAEAINNEFLRIIINDMESDKNYEDYENSASRNIHINELSHLINFKTISPRKVIQVSDRLIPGNAKMIVNHADQISAAVDIFLDIAMFNSISFLKEMSLDKKREFNNRKFRFAKNAELNAYYDCSESNPPAYWSFAFTARLDNKNIDYFKYVELWDIFLEKEYGKIDKDNIVIMEPYEQMKFHKDIRNFDEKYSTAEFWEKHNPGDWLIIRINREPNDNERKLLLAHMFGIPTFHVGAVKTIPIKDYSAEYIRKQLRELYISAFKIVV